jgi:hypothetical protein
MIEDKLTIDERIRLEALAQAVAWCARLGASPSTTIQTAKDFERYIRDERVNNAST